jgi:hypothetical protein
MNDATKRLRVGRSLSYSLHAVLPGCRTRLQGAAAVGLCAQNPGFVAPDTPS